MKYGQSYFPHDVNASQDPKMLTLRAQYGWEGVGLFWATIEAIHNAGGTLWLPYWGGYSLAIGWPEGTLREFFAYCISIGILQDADGQGVTHHRVLEVIEARKRASVNGRRGAELRHSKGGHSHPIATLDVSGKGGHSQKRKEKESNTIPIHTVGTPNERIAPPTMEQVEEYFTLHKCEGAADFWTHYEAQGWVNGNGIRITNWKAKATGWMRDNLKRKVQDGQGKRGTQGGAVSSGTGGGHPKDGRGAERTADALLDARENRRERWKIDPTDNPSATDGPQGLAVGSTG